MFKATNGTETATAGQPYGNMKNTVTPKLLIIITILVVVVAVVLVVAYANTLKARKGKSGQGTSPTPTTVSSPSAQISKPGGEAEGHIGAIVDLVTKSDGKIQLTIDGGGANGKITYLLPKDQEVTLHTSAANVKTTTPDQLKVGYIVNVIKFTNPDHYVISGVTDKGFVEKIF